MPLQHHKIACLLSFLLFFSCTGTREKPADISFEEKWPCFNGCYIVLTEGKYGLVDEEGQVLLTPSYSSIEFLNNDIALACTESDGTLCERSGRILFKGNDPDSIRANFDGIVEQIRERDRLAWEQVVEDYSRLCRECKATRGRRIFRNEFTSLESLAETVHESLKEASGKPTPSQTARLEELSADYRRAF